MGSVGSELYEALAPLAGKDEANGYALAHICEAVGRMRQLVSDLSEDQGNRPGWTGLVDVETSPAVALPWLAQIPGVKLTKGASEDVQRDEIRVRAGQARGRPAAMIAKVKATLSGTQTVRLIERAGSPWRIEIIVRPDEAPTTDIPSSNRLPNPTWDVDASGYTSLLSSTVSRQTTPTPQAGAGLGRIQTLGVVAGEGVAAAMSGTFLAGQPWTFAIYVRGDGGGETVRLRLGSGSDFAVSSVQTLTTGWVRYSVTWIPATDQTGVTASVVTSATQAVFFYVDTAMVSQSVTPQVYGDGNSPGWVWDGTANASSSHKITTSIVYAAALTQKPGGDLLTVSFDGSVLWEEATRTWDAVDPSVTWDTVTLADLT